MMEYRDDDEELIQRLVAELGEDPLRQRMIQTLHLCVALNRNLRSNPTALAEYFRSLTDVALIEFFKQGGDSDI